MSAPGRAEFCIRPHAKFGSLSEPEAVSGPCAIFAGPTLNDPKLVVNENNGEIEHARTATTTSFSSRNSVDIRYRGTRACHKIIRICIFPCIIRCESLRCCKFNDVSLSFRFDAFACVSALT